MLTIKPIRSLETTAKRFLNFIAWLAGLVAFSFIMYLLSFGAGAISASVSMVILTYLIVRRNILDISLDAGQKLLRVRHRPWFGKTKVQTYPINTLTQSAFIPALLEIPLLGTRDTGRHKLVVETPTWYKLEFFTSDYTATDLLVLHRGIEEVTQNR